MEMDRLETVEALDRRMLREAAGLGDRGARFLVDGYYAVQELRKAGDNQVRALEEAGESSVAVAWYARQARTMERQIARALDAYTAPHPIGARVRTVVGVGEVIAAGLLAHIDIERAPTAGHLWAFAGLDPSREWRKGEKRPWNAGLKTLCWKLGESFVKTQALPGSYYGPVYAARKRAEEAANARGEFAEQAARALTTKRIRPSTEAYRHYAAGRLPPAHLHARAKRVAVKLFLSHLHEVWREYATGERPPRPYAFAVLEHGHYLEPPF